MAGAAEGARCGEVPQPGPTGGAGHARLSRRQQARGRGAWSASRLCETQLPLCGPVVWSSGGVSWREGAAAAQLPRLPRQEPGTAAPTAQRGSSTCGGSSSWGRRRSGEPGGCWGSTCAAAAGVAAGGHQNSGGVGGGACAAAVAGHRAGSVAPGAVEVTRQVSPACGSAAVAQVTGRRRPQHARAVAAGPAATRVASSRVAWSFFRCT